MRKLFQQRLYFYLKEGVVFNPGSPETPFMFKFLSDDDKKILFEWHWLYSNRNLIKILPKYCREMIIDSQLNLVESRGRPYGTPEISLTLKHRLSKGAQKHIWVSTRTYNQYNTLESQLVKTYIVFILTIFDRLLANTSIKGNRHWVNFLNFYKSQVLILAKHSILETIKPIIIQDLEKKIRGKIIKTRISKLIQAICKSLLIYWNSIAFLDQNILQADQIHTVEDKNRLFELYVFFDELDKYLEDNWVPRKSDIFISAEQPMIVLEKDERIAELYLQTSKFVSQSIKDILRNFKLGTTAIFDIIVIFLNKRTEIIEYGEIIEVKRSNKHKTLRSGLEQLVWYCQSFECPNFPENIKINGKLVCWDYAGLNSTPKIESWQGVQYLFESFYKKHRRKIDDLD